MSTRTALATLAIWAGGLLALGCATPVEVEGDASRDFGGFRSWDWIPGEAIVVIAPFESEEEIRAVLAERVARELAPLGLVHAPGAGEVQVGVVYTAVRDLEYVERAGAVGTLNSFHDTPSYETQTVHMEVRAVDRCRLALYVRERATGRLVWQGAQRQQISGGCRPHLASALSRIAARLPRP